jgi:hypothetical protein
MAHRLQIVAYSLDEVGCPLACMCMNAWDSVCYNVRYVDDYFACLQGGVVEHGMQCFAELVRLMLGTTAISEKKLGFGNPLCILGLTVQVGPSGMTCFPSADKVHKWLGVLQEALTQSRLTPGAASKLAGGLSWAAQNMFDRSLFFLLL